MAGWLVSGRGMNRVGVKGRIKCSLINGFWTSAVFEGLGYILRTTSRNE